MKEGGSNVLRSERDRLEAAKVDRWNNVRVTFRLPAIGASRLQQLACENPSALRSLGILRIQVDSANSICVTLSGADLSTLPSTSSATPVQTSAATIEAVKRTLVDFLQHGDGQQHMHAQFSADSEQTAPGEMCSSMLPVNVKSAVDAVVSSVHHQTTQQTMGSVDVNQQIDNRYRVTGVSSAAGGMQHSVFYSAPSVANRAQPSQQQTYAMMQGNAVPQLSSPDGMHSNSLYSRQHGYQLQNYGQQVATSSACGLMLHSPVQYSGQSFIATSPTHNSQHAGPVPLHHQSFSVSPGAAITNSIGAGAINPNIANMQMMNSRNITTSSPLLVNLLQQTNSPSSSPVPGYYGASMSGSQLSPVAAQQFHVMHHSSGGSVYNDVQKGHYVGAPGPPSQQPFMAEMPASAGKRGQQHSDGGAMQQQIMSGSVLQPSAGSTLPICGEMAAPPPKRRRRTKKQKQPEIDVTGSPMTSTSFSPLGGVSPLSSASPMSPIIPGSPSNSTFGSAGRQLPGILVAGGTMPNCMHPSNTSSLLRGNGNHSSQMLQQVSSSRPCGVTMSSSLDSNEKSLLSQSTSAMCRDRDAVIREYANDESVQLAIADVLSSLVADRAQRALKSIADASLSTATLSSCSTAASTPCSSTSVIDANVPVLLPQSSVTLPSPSAVEEVGVESKQLMAAVLDSNCLIDNASQQVEQNRNISSLDQSYLPGEKNVINYNSFPSLTANTEPQIFRNDACSVRSVIGDNEHELSAESKETEPNCIGGLKIGVINDDNDRRSENCYNDSNCIPHAAALNTNVCEKAENHNGPRFEDRCSSKVQLHNQLASALKYDLKMESVENCKIAASDLTVQNGPVGVLSADLLNLQVNSIDFHNDSERKPHNLVGDDRDLLLSVSLPSKSMSCTSTGTVNHDVGDRNAMVSKFQSKTAYEPVSTVFVRPNSISTECFAEPDALLCSKFTNSCGERTNNYEADMNNHPTASALQTQSTVFNNFSTNARMSDVHIGVMQSTNHRLPSSVKLKSDIFNNDYAVMGKLPSSTSSISQFSKAATLNSQKCGLIVSKDDNCDKFLECDGESLCKHNDDSISTGVNCGNNCLSEHDYSSSRSSAKLNATDQSCIIFNSEHSSASCAAVSHLKTKVESGPCQETIAKRRRV